MNAIATSSEPDNGSKAHPAEIAQYLNSSETTKIIATRFGITPATLTARAKKWGVPLRGRGRKPASAPSQRSRQILELAKTQTYEVVGELVGCSKQRVHQILKKWGSECARRKPKTNIAAARAVRLPKQQTSVVSFRLTAEEIVRLSTALPGKNSVNMSARHVVRSFLGSLRS